MPDALTDAPEGESTPRVSVVLPVRNEAADIERCLSSVFEQDLAAEQVEILLVDGDSTDDTRAIAERVAAECGASDRFRIVPNPDRTAAAGMNRGIAAATAPHIARVDGHAELAPDYLSGALAILDERADAHIVGGLLLSEGEGTVGAAIALAMSSALGTGGAGFRTGARELVETDTVAFGVYRRAVFDDVGDFDERLVRNQDDELHQRVRAAGLRILLAPHLRVRYVTRSSYLALARQYWGYGLWKPRVIALRGIPSIRAFGPPLLVVLLLMATLAPVPAIGFGWPSLVPFAAYCALCLLGAAIAARRRLALTPWVAVAYVTQHLSYGGGFLLGALLPLPKPLERPD